jgi:predicted HicB family RNase H-like nuclease
MTTATQRPKRPVNRTMGIQLSVEDHKRLAVIASNQDCSMGRVIREAIREYLKKRP